MSIKKLSNSYSGSTTRSVRDVTKEIESRMTKRMDVFTDDFQPPGASEISPGQDTSKRSAPYGKPHDDTRPVADPSFWQKGREGPWANQLPRNQLHSAGDPQDQEKMDWLDEMVYQTEAPIKSPYDQFPGNISMDDHKKDTRFDPHLTDPATLKRGIKMSEKNPVKKLRTEIGPEEFHKEVEKRMKCLAIESKEPEPAKFESPYDKKDEYVPEDDNKPSKSATYNVSEP